jgi:PPOX class probable F420-dependent enzyme
MDSAEARAFLLEGTRTGKLGVVRKDGRPWVAPVWFVLDGDDLVFTTHRKTTKGYALRRDPRVVLVVDDERPPFAWARVEGTARLSGDLDELRRWATAIGERYMGADRAAEFGARNAVEGELLVRVAIERLTGENDVAGY